LISLILGRIFHRICIKIRDFRLGNEGENKETEPVLWQRADEFSGKGIERTVIIGNLPASYDHRLLLRTGRRIPIVLTEVILVKEFPYNITQAYATEAIYDDTGYFELIAYRTRFDIICKIKEVQEKTLRVQLTTANMSLDIGSMRSVEFTNPPRFWSLGEKVKAEDKLFELGKKLSGEEQAKEIHRLGHRFEKMYFTSPVFSAELILNIGQNDDHLQWGIPVDLDLPDVPNRNASDDLAVKIGIGIGNHLIDLIVEQDVLFSDYYYGPKVRESVEKDILDRFFYGSRSVQP
jgi:hypothetical protein